MDSIQTLPPRRVARQTGRSNSGLKSAPPQAAVAPEATPIVPPKPAAEVGEDRGLRELLARLVTVGLYAASSLIWFKRWFTSGEVTALVLCALVAIVAGVCVQRVFSYLLDGNE